MVISLSGCDDETEKEDHAFEEWLQERMTILSNSHDSVSIEPSIPTMFRGDMVAIANQKGDANPLEVFEFKTYVGRITESTVEIGEKDGKHAVSKIERIFKTTGQKGRQRKKSSYWLFSKKLLFILSDFSDHPELHMRFKMQIAFYDKKIPKTSMYICDSTKPAEVFHRLFGEPGREYRTGSASFKYVTQWEFGSSPAAVVEAVNIALTPDGNVVVPVPGDGAIRIYTAEGELLQELDGLAVPAGVAVDSLGNLFVAESRGASFAKYSASTTGYTVSDRGLGRGRLDFPTGIAIDKDGHVFIGDKANQKILEFDNKGGFVREVGSTDGSPSVLVWGPTTGLIALVGTDLVRIPPAGKKTARLSLGGDTPVGLGYDYQKAEIMVTSLEGRLYALDGIGAPTDPMRIEADLGVPFAVVGAREGTLFVYDIRESRILVLRSSNSFP